MSSALSYLSKPCMTLTKSSIKVVFSCITFNHNAILVSCVNRRRECMRHRSALDIMGKILQAANERSGLGRNKIMHKAFLGYAQLKEYLPTLTENGLLSYDIDSQTFKTTEKGLRFLDTYNRIYNALKIMPPSPPR